jgi:hypothetical protein
VRASEKRGNKLAATPNPEFVKDSAEVLLDGISRDMQLVNNGLRREPT